MKKSKKNPDRSRLAVACYVIAALMLTISVYMLYSNVAYLVEYASAYGMGLADMWQDVLQYSISGFCSYFAFAVLIFCAGRVMQHIKPVAMPETECQETEVAQEEEESDDEEEDEIFTEDDIKVSFNEG